MGGIGGFCSAGLTPPGAQGRLEVYQGDATIGIFLETEMQLAQNAGAWVQMSGSQKPYLFLRYSRAGGTSVIGRKLTQACEDGL